MMTRLRAAIYWFRRALRLDDNRGLLAAVAAADEVVPLFVVDPALLARADTAPVRVRFLFEGLGALDAGLRAAGGRLIVRTGDPAETLVRVARESGAGLVCFAREVEPYGKARDGAVSAALAAAGIAVRTFEDHLLAEPGSLRTQAGRPFTVFTPYLRAWSAQTFAPPGPPPPRVPVPLSLASEPLPAPPDCGQRPEVAPGEAAAQALLDDFVASALGPYAAARDMPGRRGTSRLSASLRFGMISVRRVYARVRACRETLPPEARRGVEAFLAELCWRDFYAQILDAFPQVAERAFQPRFETIAWEDDADRFCAWAQGRTGYPFVDAAMRELAATGWMHNRARMAVASFLTKDLLCDWRWGEGHFMRSLVDGDLAANNGGWQWAAGTGTDASPYFRVFNPVTQGERFDPEGVYVRRWAPELARVPARYIHRPWELSAREQEAVGCVLGKHYPARIVDHARQRTRAIALYRAAAGRDS